jgi:hypothetical protein
VVENGLSTLRMYRYRHIKQRELNDIAILKRNQHSSFEGGIVGNI